MVKATILTWMGLAMAFTVVAWFWDRAIRGAFRPDMASDSNYAEGAAPASDYVKGPSVGPRRNEVVAITIGAVIIVLLVLFAVYGFPAL